MVSLQLGCEITRRRECFKELCSKADVNAWDSIHIIVMRRVRGRSADHALYPFVKNHPWVTPPGREDCQYPATSECDRSFCSQQK